MPKLITNKLNFLQPTSLFRELVLLDEIGRNSRITQSQLAARASIVPAMVNNYIKIFIKKKYVSVQGNNRYMRYTLTPDGERYKFSLLLSYFRETVGLYKNVKEEIVSKLEQLKKENICTIILYGAAETAELVISAADMVDLKIVAIVDNDPEKQGSDFFGHLIENPSVIESVKPDAVVISSSGYQEEIYNQIKRYETEGIKVRKL